VVNVPPPCYNGDMQSNAGHEPIRLPEVPTATRFVARRTHTQRWDRRGGKNRRTK